MKLVLNKEELQKALGVGHNKALELLHRPDFPSFRLGRRWYVTKEALVEWLKEQEKRQKAQ